MRRRWLGLLVHDSSIVAHGQRVRLRWRRRSPPRADRRPARLLSGRAQPMPTRRLRRLADLKNRTRREARMALMSWLPRRLPGGVCMWRVRGRVRERVRMRELRAAGRRGWMVGRLGLRRDRPRLAVFGCRGGPAMIALLRVRRSLLLGPLTIGIRLLLLLLLLDNNVPTWRKRPRRGHSHDRRNLRGTLERRRLWRLLIQKGHEAGRLALCRRTRRGQSGSGCGR